ncbi:hypothetical protein C0992_011838, partial [Termitomyces sp. T32_za158]
ILMADGIAPPISTSVTEGKRKARDDGDNGGYDDNGEEQDSDEEEEQDKAQLKALLASLFHCIYIQYLYALATGED